MSDEEHKISYYVPQLGKVTANLYDCTWKCYSLLDQKQDIKRLHDIDQLGVIRNVYGGAHHPRWEYVILQLSLISHFNESTQSKGLLGWADYVDMISKEITGADVLQTWTLLFNAGHLPGTFATERAILRCCNKHEDLKKIINDGLPNDDETRRHFQEICEHDRVYAFHRILSSFFLERYKNNYNDQKFLDILQNCIKCYMGDLHRNDRLEKLKKSFRLIRRLSYIFLDSQYAPCPFNLNLSNVFLSVSDYVEDLFKDDDSPLNKTLEALEDLLSRDVYLSAQSIRELAHHSKQIESNTGENKEARTNVDKLFEYLQENNNFSLTPQTWGDSLNLYMLFDINPDPRRGIDKFVTELNNLEQNWYEKAQNCLLAFQQGANQKHLAIALSFYPKYPIEQNINLIGGFLSDIISLRFVDDNLDDNSVYDIIQKPYGDLMISILRYVTDVTDTKYSYKFKSKNQLGGYVWEDTFFQLII